MSYWDKKENLSKYVGGVRQFFPLAEEQLDMISRIMDILRTRKPEKK